MVAEKKRARKAKPRETGTAGQSGSTKTRAAETLPRDPPSLGRPMTEDERIDEASLESMDGSDPPSYSATRSGEPRRPEDADAGADEETIRRRAYALWEQDGRPSGRGDEYWHRAEQELRKRGS